MRGCDRHSTAMTVKRYPVAIHGDLMQILVSLSWEQAPERRRMEVDEAGSRLHR
jgi:hypothetical protein